MRRRRREDVPRLEIHRAHDHRVEGRQPPLARRRLPRRRRVTARIVHDRVDRVRLLGPVCLQRVRWVGGHGDREVGPARAVVRILRIERPG